MRYCEYLNDYEKRHYIDFSLRENQVPTGMEEKYLIATVAFLFYCLLSGENERGGCYCNSNELTMLMKTSQAKATYR